MGQHSTVIDFPGKNLMFTRRKLEVELERLREKLLPFYEDEEELLDKDIKEKKNSDIGAVGIMNAIAWCHGQIAIYEMLNEEYSDDG